MASPATKCFGLAVEAQPISNDDEKQSLGFKMAYISRTTFVSDNYQASNPGQAEPSSTRAALKSFYHYIGFLNVFIYLIFIAVL